VESLAAAFLLVLVLAWVVVCLPAANRARERSPLLSTQLFKRGLERIGSDTHGHFLREFGRSPEASPRPIATRVRRVPTVLFCLLALGAVGTAAAAIVEGGSMWEMHLATDAALAIFISLLIEEKHRKLECRRKVRSLASRRRAPAPLAVPAEEAGGLRLVAGAE
jgi:hypothetical protein